MKRILSRWKTFLLVLGCAGLCIGLRAAEQPKNNPPKLEENPAASMPPTPPKKSNVQVRFEGASHFPEATLRAAIAEQITVIEQQSLTPALADDTAFFLGIFYRKNGYSQADVKFRIDGPRALTLTVAAGPLTTLGDITLHGNSGEPDATLRDYIIGATRERFPHTKTALPFVQADVDTGVERIRGLYRSEGFLDAVVDDAKVTFNRDHTRADVFVNIHEGTRYRFGKIDFNGDIVFFHGGDTDPELQKLVKPFAEKPYTPQQVTNMQRAVVYFYKTRGYYDVKVDVDSDPANAHDGAVPTTFRIDSGNVYRFDGVSQEGLDRLSAKFLPSRFASLSGKFYNPQVLDEKFREMMRTGLFKQLRIEPRPLPDHTIELHMKVEEAKAKELGFLLGYGTYEGAIIGVSAADRDLFGTGRPLTTKIELSQRFLKGEIVYDDPWFWESPYELRLRLYGIGANFDGYSKIEEGIRAELSRKLTKKLEATLFVGTRHESITDDGIVPEVLGPTSYLVNAIGSAITLDYRDSAINPTRGSILNTTVDYAGSVLGSDIDFVRSTARFSYYIPIKKTTLAFGARAGILVPTSGSTEDIPIDERFFNGGSRSVRSFSERDLGPHDRHGYPIGGDSFSVFNVEYTFPIWGDLLGATFVDAGSVGRDSTSFGVMRYGIGGGIRYRTPVGPLRIDYGVNPSPRNHEHAGALNISFGVAF